MKHRLWLISLSWIGISAAPAAESKTSSIGLKMLPIPAGTFTMGSPSTEKSRGRDEDQVEVELTEPFLMGETEVTQAQWKAVMKTSTAEQVASKDGPLGRGANLVDEASATGPDQPMCFVNWADALRFCEQLTELDREAGVIDEGFKYSLPTEAQWEYACRAGTTTVFAFGDTLTSDQANFFGKMPYGVDEEGEYREKTTVVKTFKPNAWGLYDMHGNLYEWCLDWYGEALEGGKDPVGPAEGDGYIIRGGTWNRKATSCRSAYRYSSNPTARGYNIGFRVVLVKADE